MVIAAHAMRENHYAFLVLNLKVSYVPKSQDKHNASSFFVCPGRSYLNPIAKIVKLYITLFFFIPLLIKTLAIDSWNVTFFISKNTIPPPKK